MEFFCRLCASNDDFESTTIFNSFINNISLVEIINRICYKITVLENDELPRTICKSCLNTLKIAHELCEKSLATELELRNLSSQKTIKCEELEYEQEDFSTESVVNYEHSIKNDISMSEELEDAVNLELNLKPEIVLPDEDIKTLIADSSEEQDKNKKYQCETCLKRFAKPSKLKRHISVHDITRKPYGCEEPDCLKRFLKPESLARHQLMHKGLIESKESQELPLKVQKNEKNQFVCNLCDKVFEKLNDLTRHSKSHDEYKKYKCQICSKVFGQGSHLVDHINRHNGIRTHVCHVCNKAFQQSSTLKDHLRTHSQEKPFLCSVCGRAFNNPSNLRQHVKRHSNQKQFECHLCIGKFSCKASLQSHLRSHDGIKSHACQLCGSQFTKGSSLKKHVKTVHEKIKDHQCTTCSMKFSSAEHLKRHFRVHSGEKPYRCDFSGCNKSYAQSNDLLKHKKCHLGENVYKCSFENCEESFRLKNQLRDHYAIHKTTV